MKTMLLGLFLWASVAHAEVLGFSQLTGPAAGSSDQIYVDIGAASASSVALVLPYGVTTSDLWCESDTAPDNGATETWTVTVQKALAADPTTFSDTTQVCTITDAATSCNDTTHTTSFSAGDRIAIRVAVTAGTPAATARMTCSVKAV